jgi:hypothetical protein
MGGGGVVLTIHNPPGFGTYVCETQYTKEKFRMLPFKIKCLQFRTVQTKILKSESKFPVHDKNKTNKE